MDIILESDRICFSYTDRPLLCDLSLNLAPGNLLHLVGHNGAGKSTFLAILAGILPPESGEVRVREKRSTNTKEAEHIYGSPSYKMFLSYLLPEHNGFFLKLSALANLDFFARLRGLHLARENLIAELKGWGFGSFYVMDFLPVAKFSTGMKRRLALAMISIGQAPFWILDEPIFGLDKKALDIFRDKLKAHLSRGGAALIASHDSAPFQGIDHNRYLLEKGRGMIK